jgi:predicted small secreted protein
MKKNYIVLSLLIVVISIFLTGCMPGNDRYTKDDQ